MDQCAVDFDLNLGGHVALVTGASSGLGYRFAEVLAAAGAAVAVAGRRYDRLCELADRLRLNGSKALAVELDVRSADAIDAAVAHVTKELGQIDILVNNAGVSDGDYATRLPLARIDDVIETNFRAPFLLSCAVARRLMAVGKPGRIVNIASDGAFHYPQNAAAALYCASKAGVVRLTETLASEWAPFHINVNAIAPGLFHSEMSAAYLEKHEGDVLATMPRGRIGEPHKLDGTLLYLVSPSSDFVTGICIRVDDAQKPR